MEGGSRRPIRVRLRRIGVRRPSRSLWRLPNLWRPIPESKEQGILGSVPKKRAERRAKTCLAKNLAT